MVHVAVSPVTIAINPKRVDACGMAPIAVSPGLQNQGIGGALIRAGHDAARLQGVGAVILLGSVAYFSRSGFQPARSRGLT